MRHFINTFLTISAIVNDLISNTKKLKLLDIALKHTLPKLSIEKHIADDRLIKEDIYIHIIGRDGKEISKEKTNV